MAEGAEVVTQPGATIGQSTVCPVNGLPFVIEETTPSVEHAGETWYVCCFDCKLAAQADPSVLASE